MKYVLASKSPRRQELMKLISSNFVVASEDINEESSYTLSPINAVEDIAKRKGEAVEKLYPNDLIISADTIVVLDNKIIGKPADKADAKRLSKEIISHVTSEVIFNDLSDELIDKYVASGSPLDKAGAYGVQDNDKYPIIKKVIGSIDNVIWFPLKEIKEAIEQIKK